MECISPRLMKVLLLGACPFPERLDLPWFSAALADLGPRFHALSVRVALGIPRPAARTAAVLGAVEESGVAVAVALDELCPPPAGGGSAVCVAAGRCWRIRHFDTLVRTLVRAGRARGMVAASLATGKREEAYRLCQMHYAVTGASDSAPVGAGSGGAGGVRKGDGDGDGDAGTPTNALARFAKQFGLPLPPV